MQIKLHPALALVLAASFATACGSSDSTGTGGTTSSDAGSGGGGGAPSTVGSSSVSGSGGFGGSAVVTTGAGPTSSSAASTSGDATSSSSAGSTSASSSSASSSSSSSTGSGSPSTGCGVQPVTPNATQQTKNVLCYLYSQYGNHILSGQEENATGQASGADVEFNYILSTTGKVPVVRAFDVNNGGNDTRCLAQWNANGLCMFGYHMGVANGLPDGYTSSQTKVSINTVLTEGSDLNTTFKARMDKAAAEIKSVQDGGGVVLWRPFHEAGGTWFWWSMEGGAQYVKLWKYMFNYMTATKGLKNIIWLLPYDGSPDASFYPGKAYVDIGGADNYNKANDYSPMTSLFNNSVKIFGSTMPVALHECGPVPDPDQLQSAKANWLFFSIWTAPFPEQSSTAAELKKVYSSSYVVTRDEMPSLK